MKSELPPPRLAAMMDFPVMDPPRTLHTTVIQLAPRLGHDLFISC